MKEDTKTPQENENHNMRTRAAKYIKDITRPEVVPGAVKELLHEFANTYVYTRYSLSTGVLSYLYFVTSNHVDGALSTVLNREQVSQEQVTNLTFFTPDNSIPIEVINTELQVA